MKLLEQRMVILGMVTTIANIVHKLIHTAEAFRTRALPRCSVIYLDGTYVPLKRKYGYHHASVEKECIEIAIGITEEDHRQVLGFYTVPNEGAQNWEYAPQDLKRRGIGEPKLFITDGLRGLPEAISNVFPKTQHQTCVVHIQRNISKNVRLKDCKETCSDFKVVYEQDNHRDSLRKFQAFINKWSHAYPKLCDQLMNNDDIFTFYSFPKLMHQYIRTSNAIESFNATLKRKSRSRILFNGEDNASLVIVQEAAAYNSDWAKRIVPFIRDLSEEEKQALGLYIFTD